MGLVVGGLSRGQAGQAGGRGRVGVARVVGGLVGDQAACLLSLFRGVER